jgi:protoporphyrinogen/coproporphyrinogen III oxidase
VTTPPRHALVIGAGLAGLAAAWRLSRAGARVSVLERGAGVGGRLAGMRVEGYPLEPTPALIGPADTHLLAWIGELGLRDALLPAKPVVTAFVSKDGLCDVELRSLRDVARIPGVRRRHVWRLVRLPRLLARYGGALTLGAAAEANQFDDRSLADFARLYFGASVLEHWMAPVACATSLGDPEQMSRVQFLQHYRANGIGRFGVLQGSLGDLCERAAAGLAVVTHCRVDRIEAGPDGFRATAADGRAFDGDAVVLAVPAPIAGRIADPLLVTPERSFLAGVRYVPALAVAAALCRPLVPRARFAAIAAEAGSPLGSLLVEPGFRGGRVPDGGGLALLRATGAFAAAHPETPSETLEKELLAEIDRLWPGFGRSVEFTRVFRHRYGAPRFDVGAYRALASFARVQADRRAAGRQLAFAGDYRVHPSLEGAVRSGERAAAELLGTL